MPKVIFNVPVKYKKKLIASNTVIEIEQSEVASMLADGGHLIEEPEEGQKGQSGLGNVSTPAPKTGLALYKSMNKDAQVAELTARGISLDGLTNAEQRAKALADDDEAEAKKAEEAQKLANAKIEADNLKVEYADDVTLEKLLEDIEEAKKAGAGAGGSTEV